MRPGSGARSEASKIGVGSAMDSARGRDLRSAGYGCQASRARKRARMVFPEHYSIGIRDFHLKTNLLSQINVIWGVQMARQKYSDFPKPQISLYP
jgi:hypothetical protein